MSFDIFIKKELLQNNRVEVKVMEKYSGYIYAGIILIIVGGISAFIGYQMAQNVETYNVGGLPISDFLRIANSDINNYYITGQLLLIGGIIVCAIGFVVLIVFAIIQNQESIAKNKVKNIPSQNVIMNLPAKDEAMGILRTRYAKGEVTKEQYDQMKKDLEN
jgi:uncharacterized membrane protein